MPGLLVLNGGDEFKPGNEPQDRWLVAASGRGPAYVVPTAALRQRPELAVANARRWFADLGLDLVELPVRSRWDAASPTVVARAAEAGLFYLVGGDPGLLVRTLAGTPLWRAIEQAWRAGAALAGSSAGAMALCAWTLVMARWPRHDRRRPRAALGVVPDSAVLPHYNAFGQRWTIVEAPAKLVLLGLDERTAAIWDAGWRAAGAGSVTVIDGATSTTFEAGSRCAGIPAPRVAAGEAGP